MKRYNQVILGIGVAAVCLTSFTGCIDETQPTSIATETQVAASTSASEALVMAMPAYFNKTWTLSSEPHYDYGYSSIMHVRDVLTGDLAVVSSGYDWYSPWAEANGIDENKARTQYIWNYYYQFIQSINNAVGGVDASTATSDQLGYLGTSLAFRALAYLDMARMYEFLENDKVSSVNKDNHDVKGLTVPIVKAGMDQDSARNNPRATHAQMAAFIENDLNEAEEYVVNLKDTKGQVLPDLACVYGLKARLYMWNEDYAKAQEYARKAIDASTVAPMTATQCLNTTTGFNDASAFMWAAQQTSEDESVKTGIVNWTSWMSNEAFYGYASAGPYVMIDKSMYDRISNNDFRKLEFKCPDDSPLASLISYIDKDEAANFPTYASLKFRPNQGNGDEYQVGSAAAYPIMRVEEMYFIEAEAAAHQDPAKGKALVEAFMKNYRDANYACNETTKDDVVEEIVFQKRVELWGEGQSFYDIKRLNYSVTRGYKGTNFADLTRYNTNGRPAWMNLVIVITEKNNNKALDGWNNPDVTSAYTPWKDPDEQ